VTSLLTCLNGMPTSLVYPPAKEILMNVGGGLACLIIITGYQAKQPIKFLNLIIKWCKF